MTTNRRPVCDIHECYTLCTRETNIYLTIGGKRRQANSAREATGRINRAGSCKARRFRGVSNNRWEGSTILISRSHLFLAQLAHGDRFIPSVVLSRKLELDPRPRGLSRRTRTRRTRRARVREKKNRPCSSSRDTALAAEMCQKLRQSLHICLRLDVNAVIWRRVTASRSLRRRLFKTAEQPTSVSPRALYLSLSLSSLPLSLPSPPPSLTTYRIDASELSPF